MSSRVPVQPRRALLAPQHAAVALVIIAAALGIAVVLAVRAVRFLRRGSGRPFCRADRRSRSRRSVCSSQIFSEQSIKFIKIQKALSFGSLKKEIKSKKGNER